MKCYLKYKYLLYTHYNNIYIQILDGYDKDGEEVISEQDDENGEYDEEEESGDEIYGEEDEEEELNEEEIAALKAKGYVLGQPGDDDEDEYGDEDDYGEEEEDDYDEEDGDDGDDAGKNGQIGKRSRDDKGGSKGGQPPNKR